MSEKKAGFDYKIDCNSEYGMLTVKLPTNNTIKVEASAMATMDAHLSMKTRLKGGFKRFLSNESLFINEFTAQGGPGEILIAPGPPGAIAHQYLNPGENFYLTGSAFLACAPTVNYETKWQGLAKGLFSGEGLFLIKCSGEGDLWFNTFGALFEVDVKGDYVVDTGHIVAFTEGLDYDIEKPGGYKSLFFSGEGFVARFRGSGKVWIQTKSPQAIVAWAHWFRPVEKSSN